MSDIKKITGEVEISSQTLALIKKEATNISSFQKIIENFLSKNATELLGVILAGAINLKASDIHIESEEERAKLRIRVDGVLLDVMYFELKNYQVLLSRIKLLSALRINVTDRPQDGRFTILLPLLNEPHSSNEEKTTIEIRTSTLPAEYGEAVVLRILNPQNLIEVESLGLRKDLVNIFEKEIAKPNGMFIVTGPTGSGKTTTLYAILKKINSPEVKIITIEDPVEYHLEGLSQTQTDSDRGYTFANGLKALMRQDPDVILVGEIRDLETAEIAIQAALTGHLVFSTLHTNDAAGAIARLIDLGVKPSSIAPALNIVVAQRLPRKVCKKCVEFITPSTVEIEKIKKGIGDVFAKLFPSISLDKGVKIPRAKGCPDCNNTGYRDRIGIYETFLVDDEMEKFILTSPPIVAMKELAIKKGMILMQQDGLIKVLEGITTIEEIERVAGE